MKKKEKRKINFFRIGLILLFLFFISVLLFFVKSSSNPSSIQTDSPISSPVESLPVETPKQEAKTITITAIGDIMCHNTQYQDAYLANSDTYDFSYVFEDIKDHFKQRDLVIGNLETTFAGKKVGYSSYPCFNTPEQLAQNLKDLGIDVLSTANNHCLDTRYLGIENTLNQLDTVGISHMGTARSKEEQDKILIKQVGGMNLAFLSYTYGTNGILVPKGKEYCVNLIDKELMAKQIEQAKQERADLIIVNVHWGIEYRLEPTKEQEELATFLFENGVDIILGSHPHVLEPMEKKQITTVEGEEKECFVIYSLGNFMSGQTKENTKDSILLNLTITKSASGKISIDQVDYTPIYCYTTKGKSKSFLLLDIQKNLDSFQKGAPSYINTSNVTFFQKELSKIQNMVSSRMPKVAE